MFIYVNNHGWVISARVKYPCLLSIKYGSKQGRKPIDDYRELEVICRYIEAELGCNYDKVRG